MQTTEIKSSMERAILSAMITSKPFLAGIVPVLDVDLLPTEYVQRIARWCIEYFKQQTEAPGRNVESIFHGWVESEKPEPSASEAISDFLGSMSAEYDSTEPLNAKHLLDQTSSYLTHRKLVKLQDTINYATTMGNDADAITAIQEFRSISVGDSVGYYPNRKSNAIEVFSAPMGPIIHMPGDSARFFGPALTRDAFIGIQAPEKRGKSWWIIEFLYWAIRSRLKVALFQVGDLSKTQLDMRWYMRMAQRPLWPDQLAGVKMPTKIEMVDGPNGRKAAVQHNVIIPPGLIDLQSAVRAIKMFHRRHQLPIDKPSFMFSVHPNYSINIAGIDGVLHRWNYEQGFVPDVVLIDYMDILAPEKPRKSEQEEINETWAAARRLSQVWHACVIAPTQADATANETKTQKTKNFSRDKRKYSHVTGMMGLNQTAEEKQSGIMRINWLALRESPFDIRRCLHVAQCIPLSMALVKSIW